MPATKGELVSLMFGQELAPQTRSAVPLGQTGTGAGQGHAARQRVTVEDLTLNIRAGEVIGLAGLDGSGQELIVRGVRRAAQAASRRECASAGRI